MRQARPTSVLVIAIFHFVFGGLGLVCNLCGMAGQMISGAGGGAMFQTDPRQAQMQRDIQTALEKAAPSNKPVQIADSAISLCLSCVLLAAGVGLLNLAPWGRSLSLAYGCVALAKNLALVLYAILVTLPAMSTMMGPLLAQARTPQERQMMELIVMFSKVGGFIGALIPLIYPFVVLVVMNTAAVKNAFHGAPLLDDDRGRALEEGHASTDPYRGPDDRFKA